MFSGLISRCRTPAAWAKARASATSPTMRTASSAVELHFAREPRPERLALYVRHRVVEHALCLTGVVNAEDVRVLQP